MSELNNINLVFVLPPRKTSHYISNLYASIPEKNKIQLADALEFPQLYIVNHSFDVGHLNTKGSEIYSKLLAIKLLELEHK